MKTCQIMLSCPFPCKREVFERADRGVGSSVELHGFPKGGPSQQCLGRFSERERGAQGMGARTGEYIKTGLFYIATTTIFHRKRFSGRREENREDNS